MRNPTIQAALQTLRRCSGEIVAAWNDAYVTSMGAALAFYTAFSLPPLLVLLIAVAGLFFSTGAAQSLILSQLGDLMGPAGAGAVGALLSSGQQRTESAVAALLGAATLLVGATSVFAELQTDLDRIWKAPPSIQPQGVWGMIRTRFLSFGLILGLGFLLVVSLALSAALAAMSRWYGGYFGSWVTILRVVNFVVSFASIAVVFTLIYKILPSVRIRWHDAAVGGVVTALLFSVGKFLIGVYLGNSRVVTAYGAAGSLLVVLLWIYYSAEIFLLGALLTRIYSHRRSAEGSAARGRAQPG